MELVVVVVVAAVLLGLIPAAIAQSRGRDFLAWWFYGAALFLFALPHSLMLERVEGHGARKCPFCAEFIKEEAKVCRFCGRDLPELSLPEPVSQRRSHSRRGQDFGRGMPEPEQAALREARRRWGVKADIAYEGETNFVGQTRRGFLGASLFDVLGQGKSWDEAFADADAKAAQSRAEGV